MNIKSLLLGSAAALAAVSGAQAADAIVAAEPEPMEYVRVCDAFGTGYFYIPGTETCLKIGGYVRFQTDFGRTANSANAGDWDSWTRGRLEVTSKSSTELGELTGFMAIHGEASRDNLGGTPDPFYFDEVYIQLGGFKVGTYLNWFDNDLAGELDVLSNVTRYSAVSYTYTGDVVTAGIQVDEISREDTLAGIGDGQGVGVEGIVRAALGPVALELLGAYDIDAEEGVVRGMASAEIGPGTLALAAAWASGDNTYYNASEATVAVNYAIDVTEKLQIIPEFQYFWSTDLDAGGDFTGDDDWSAGATVNYKIVEGLSTKVAVGYNDNADSVGGIVRLQRSF